MSILALETSCDETGAALVENGTKILANVVASSVALHQKSGGIIPETAARQQLAFLLPVLEEALRQCQPQKDPRQTLKEDIDAIAATAGPGLVGSLVVGVEAAKTLSFLTGKPLLPINHLLGHLFANWLEKEEKDFPPLPAVALIASGGHTDLVKSKRKGQGSLFTILAGRAMTPPGNDLTSAPGRWAWAIRAGRPLPKRRLIFPPKKAPKSACRGRCLTPLILTFLFPGLKPPWLIK